LCRPALWDHKIHQSIEAIELRFVKKKEKHVFAKKSLNLQKQAENQTKTSLHETEPDSFRFEDNN